MYRKLLANDFKKNVWQNLILLLFIVLSAAIIASVVLMLTQLFSSISDMYEAAKPPHFLQMHKGEIYQSDIDEFNESYHGIEHWQTVPMIDVYGEDISVNGLRSKSFDLADCRLDIGLVRQNDNYDVLLDADRRRLNIASGEIGVPVILTERYDIAVGDTLTLCSGDIEKKFRVSAFVYDAQMNSTLCSSTRFLLSDADFESLIGNIGETEYLIEVYFTDRGLASEYQTAYEQSEKNLPKDGQAVTYIMIFLLSAMTDMMTAMVFLLAGVVMVVIAMICLRYCLLIELEGDVREIGTMKAIGISENGIRSLYLVKLRILATVGSAAGLAAAFALSRIFNGHMLRTFGAQRAEASCYGYGAAFAICILVYVFIMLFARGVLKKLRHLSVVDLLVTEKGFSKPYRIKDGLHKARRLNFDFLVGIHEAHRGYGLIFVMLLLVSFLMITPARIVGTMESKDFVTYMGSPLCDILLEVEQGEGLEERKTSAEAILLREMDQGRITGYELTRRVRLQAMNEQGKAVGLHIDTGSSAGSGLKYLFGGRPETSSEIALSSIMADELGKTTGEYVLLRTCETEIKCKVSGIYQDVTSGGRTAKMVREFPNQEAQQYTFQIHATEGADISLCTEEWCKQLGTSFSIENMEQFIGQTLGGVTAQIKQLAWDVSALGIILTALITLLFIRLRLTRQMGETAIKRILGLSWYNIFLHELIPVILTGVFGILAGLLLTEFLGESVVSTLLGLLGIGLDRLEFSSMPVMLTMGISSALLAACGVMVFISCMNLRHKNLAQYFND